MRNTVSSKSDDLHAIRFNVSAFGGQKEYNIPIAIAIKISQKVCVKSKGVIFVGEECV
jgi:hypothetical protein